MRWLFILVRLLKRCLVTVWWIRIIQNWLLLFLFVQFCLFTWPLFILHRLMVSANKLSYDKCTFSSVKLNSSAVPSYHVAHDMLHVVNTWCVAHDLHTIAPWSVECTCWKQFTVHWGECKNLELRLGMRLSLWSLLLLLLLSIYFIFFYGWLGICLPVSLARRQVHQSVWHSRRLPEHGWRWCLIQW